MLLPRVSMEAWSCWGTGLSLGRKCVELELKLSTNSSLFILGFELASPEHYSYLEHIRYYLLDYFIFEDPRKWETAMLSNYLLSMVLPLAT